MNVYRCLNCGTQQVALVRLRRCLKGCAGAYLSQEAELLGMSGCDEARAVAMAQSEGDRLTKAMRERGRDVSAMSGRIERESPLFFGHGDNPTLF